MSESPPIDTPEIIKALEKHIYDADITAMAGCIGELHQRWQSLTEGERSQVLKLDAIFLTLLNARAKRTDP
jgi:hypothetical protein